MTRRVLIFALIFLPILVALVAYVTFVWTNLFVASGPNLILNGSFEEDGDRNFVHTASEPLLPDPKDAPDCKALCGGSGALPHWSVFRGQARQQDCNNAGDAVCWARSPNSLKIDASDGRFSVDLTGFRGRPPEQFGAVRQVVEKTQAGQTYELAFALGSSSVTSPNLQPPNNDIRVQVRVFSTSNPS